jgi:hypothetical protein
VVLGLWWANRELLVRFGLFSWSVVVRDERFGVSLSFLSRGVVQFERRGIWSPFGRIVGTLSRVGNTAYTSLPLSDWVHDVFGSLCVVCALWCLVFCLAFVVASPCFEGWRQTCLEFWAPLSWRWIFVAFCASCFVLFGFFREVVVR